MGCVFCRIVTGEEPALIVQKTDKAMAFLPRQMSVRGHTLVIPKRHVQNFFTIPKEDLSAVFMLIKNLAAHYRNALGATGMNILHASGGDAQQSVDHFHIHLLPRFPGDGVDAWPCLPGCSDHPENMLMSLQIPPEKGN